MESSLALWEVSLIRGMLAHTSLNKQEILAYFSLPERSINPARIAEIVSGTHEHAGTKIASPTDIREFMANYPSVRYYMDEWEQRLGP